MFMLLSLLLLGRGLTLKQVGVVVGVFVGGGGGVVGWLFLGVGRAVLECCF